LELIDWVEELHQLYPVELAFRSILKRKFSSLIHLVAVTTRQIGKITWCIFGDEDTRFFHSRASTRLKSNKIKVVEQDGIRSFTHKECIFMNYYQDLLGKSTSTQELIDLEEVYPFRADLSTLTQPFSEDKIHNALKLIPRDKSPSPDGFSSGFYQDFWSLIKPDILNLFQHFFEGRLQVDRNNRSYIVLIKKKEDCCAPCAYRPISLLNCSVKLITKALALRL
jgi:hypothetical protein